MLTMLAVFVLTTSLMMTYVIPTSARSLNKLDTHLDQVVQNNDTETDLTIISSTDSTVQRERQEEGEAGLEIGQNVGEIISGVLGGGLGNIFQGSSNFIGDAGAQEQVNFILKNISPSLDVVLKYGWDGLKQYFGVGRYSTTLKPVVVQSNVTRAPVMTNVSNTGGTSMMQPQPVIVHTLDVQPYPQLQQPVTAPSVIFPVTDGEDQSSVTEPSEESQTPDPETDPELINDLISVAAFLISSPFTNENSIAKRVDKSK